MATAVIDANVLVGLLDDQDHWHESAVALRDALDKSGAMLVYFDCVINESISVLARRTYEQKRTDQLDILLDQLDRLIPVWDVTWVSGETQRLYPEIVKLIRASSGKLNFHDALIAIICREQELTALISFDRDFDELTWLNRIGQASEIAKLFDAEGPVG
jgi:predicted nucleic acid-binding protein